MSITGQETSAQRFAIYFKRSKVLLTTGAWLEPSKLADAGYTPRLFESRSLARTFLSRAGLLEQKPENITVAPWSVQP